MADLPFHIDTGFSTVRARGQRVSGDVCIMRRRGRRTVVVLTDGAGVGIRANTVAETIAAMCAGYCLDGYPARKMARAVLAAFPPEAAGQAHASFTTVVFDGKTVTITVFGNPDVLVFHNEKPVEIENLWGPENGDTRHGTFTPSIGDRVVIYTDGVINSGIHTKRLPEGWKETGLGEFLTARLAAQGDISSDELSREITARAETNDLFSPRGDMTAAVLYFRTPRRLLVCSGPPFNENKDAILADMVEKYPGRKIICGGTTSKIISREVGRQVTVELGRDTSGLPPASRMDGVDMITEGVLTLGRVKHILETLDPGSPVGEKGAAGEAVRMMLGSDRVDFMVGTRVNPMHQDPNLPVELELRRNVIKEIARLLQERFLKETHLDYI